MHSWDFFDTLLGRACGEPWRVFELIGGEEFKTLRQLAEKKSDKTFEHIYTSLRQMTGWSASKIDDLRTQEWDWERKLAFPIVPNTSRVGADDLIITDTYFNKAQIRALADCIQLPQTLEIYASYGDKHNGTIWQKYRAAKTKITRHVGDNKHSDYVMARRHGIPGVFYGDGEFVGFEKFLQRAGHWDVAAIARCARMQNPYVFPDTRANVWQRYALVNVPFLLLCAAKLHTHIKEKGYKRAAFVTRDTVLLHKVFKQLYPEIETTTFYASRQTYKRPSESFLLYAQKEIEQPKTVFVDLQGTGKSAYEFMRAHKFKMNYVFCAAPTNLPNYVPSLFQINKLGTALEVFNYDTNGRVLDVVDGQPVRDTVEYDLDLVRVGHAVVESMLRCVFQLPTPPTAEVFQQLFNQMNLVPQKLLAQHIHDHPYR